MQVFVPVVQVQEKVAFSVGEDLPGGTERILFIDDEEMMATMGSRTLQRYGYTVTTATGSTAALALFRQQPRDFELVFTDQTMPDITGAELATAVLEIRPGLPIILCTGHASQISEIEAKALGIREFCLQFLDTKQPGLFLVECYKFQVLRNRRKR